MDEKQKNEPSKTSTSRDCGSLIHWFSLSETDVPQIEDTEDREISSDMEGGRRGGGAEDSA